MRRLILLGSYIEHITADDPAAKDRVMKGLDGFLERDRDRALFDLAPQGGPQIRGDGAVFHVLSGFLFFIRGALAPRCLWSFPGFGPNPLSFRQKPPLLLNLISDVFHRRFLPQCDVFHRGKLAQITTSCGKPQNGL